jgi:hypothetical protein
VETHPFGVQAADAKIAPEFIEVGEKLYKSGLSSGISEKSWDSLRATKIFLKAPITTPSGGGYKSLVRVVGATGGAPLAAAASARASKIASRTPHPPRPRPRP